MRKFVLGRLDIQRLPETGATVLNLGVLEPRVLRHTCGIGLHASGLDIQYPTRPTT